MAQAKYEAPVIEQHCFLTSFLSPFAPFTQSFLYCRKPFALHNTSSRIYLHIHIAFFCITVVALIQGTLVLFYHDNHLQLEYENILLRKLGDSLLSCTCTHAFMWTFYTHGSKVKISLDLKHTHIQSLSSSRYGGQSSYD